MQTQSEIPARETEDERSRRRGWAVWTYAAAALVVAVLLGGTAWMVWGGGESPWAGEPDQPSVIFDGEEATYRGPTSLEKGRFTVTFENTHDATVLLGYETHNRDDVTLDEAHAWYREYGDGRPPPWQSEFFGITGAAPDMTAEGSLFLFDGRYMLYLWLEEAHRIVPVVIVEVTADGIDIFTD